MCSGACTNIQTDPNNCGACGTNCGAFQNGVGGCQSGTCAVFSCNAGYADCDKNPSNGCEVNLQTDARNCGACGNVCFSNQSCTAGACH
jgi:hypothetical protein